MSRPNNASILIAAIVHAGCAGRVAEILAEVGRECARRGEENDAAQMGVLANSVLELQGAVSDRVSAQLATVRGG